MMSREEQMRYDGLQPVTVGQLMIDQYPTPDGWICGACKWHGGGVSCDKNFFIAFAGGNTKGCAGFERR